MKIYDGSCHCGNIKYTVALEEALAPEGKGTINRCNCSICTKNGDLTSACRLTLALLTLSITGYFLVYPKREDVVFKDGCDSKMKTYAFGKKVKPHRFCPECSSSILIDFKDSDVDGQQDLLAMNVSRLQHDAVRARPDITTRQANSRTLTLRRQS